MFLKSETVKQENAAETLFCMPFEKLPRLPMSKELMEIIISIMLSQNVNIPQSDKPLLYQAIEKRAQHCFTFKINDQKLLLFLCFLTQTPGMAVMYLTYLQYWCRKHNVKEMDFDTFCERVFPMGFPAKAEVSKLWDSVKVRRSNGMSSDNLLDYQTALSSIQFAGA